jgi:hydroxymethylpyrimidine/phosphomethylpyrimidine kinase
MHKKMVVLTIAGSDPGAGAGIQSDLKTFHNNGVYGVTVITALTSQNTKGIKKAFEVPASIVRSQLEILFEDFPIKTAKTGMLSSHKIIDTICNVLKNKKNLKLIIDPVLYSKNKFPMVDNKGIRSLLNKLVPLSYLITPNISETEILTGIKIRFVEDMELAAKILIDRGAKNVLIKGGHLSPSVGLQKGTDLLLSGGQYSIFPPNYIDTKNTYGIGCTLSAAIAAKLALGKNLETSIIESKNYIQQKLRKTVKLGKGTSPVEQ